MSEQTGAGIWPKIGLVCGILGVLLAVWAYWLLVPGVVLGIAAVVLGVRERRRGPSELGAAAIALGVCAILLVPSVLVVADDAEEYGRDCALNPSSPDC